MRLVRRLTVALLGAFAVLFAAQAWLGIREFVESYEADSARDHRVLARALSAAASAVWVRDGQAAALDVIEAANEREPSTRIRIVAVDVPDGSPDAPALGVSVEPLLQQSREVVRIVREDGPSGRLYSYVPLRVNGELVGALELSDSLDDERRYVASHTLQTGIVTLTSVLVCGGLAWLMGMRFVGAPVAQLVAQARRIGAGDLSHRIHLTRDDELSDVARELNATTDRLVEARRHLENEAVARIAALEALQHAERLTTVGRLASGIAHELGTPLNVVSGHAEAVADGEIRDDVEIRASARIIREQVQRMTRILRQLLDFARNRVPERVLVDLDSLVAEAGSLLAPLARRHGVGISIRRDGGATTVRIDPDQVHQVVVNLLMNAIQASSAGGEVRVRIEREAGDGMVCIAVEDDGEGMESEVVEHVFDPFFTTKPVGEGTGLGLSVAHGIVSEHRGRIEIRSEPGRGSRFRVLLPEVPA